MIAIVEGDRDRIAVRLPSSECRGQIGQRKDDELLGEIRHAVGEPSDIHAPRIPLSVAPEAMEREDGGLVASCELDEPKESGVKTRLQDDLLQRDHRSVGSETSSPPSFIRAKCSGRRNQ